MNIRASEVYCYLGYLTHKSLRSKLRRAEQMSEDDRTVIKRLIDAFITKSKLKQLAL